MADEDIILHAMTHLIFGDDLADKLRELIDIDDLLQNFTGADESFWQRLAARAEKLDLRRPAFYSLRYAQRLLQCPVPKSTLDNTRDWAPAAPILWLMDRLVRRRFEKAHVGRCYVSQPKVATAFRVRKTRYSVPDT